MRKQPELYSAKVMTCPSCGASFLSTGTQTAGTCVYCLRTGAFESRMQPIPAPEYLIPFSVTKAACRKRYQNQIRNRIFAPAQLRSSTYQEHFRGMYLPYWDYRITQKGESTLEADRLNGAWDERLTMHVSFDTMYEGIFYDGCAGFDDGIAAQIAPFYYQAMQPFSAEYLSGMYAGVTDVASSVYERDAMNFANDLAQGTLPLLKGMDEEERDSAPVFCIPETEQEKDALFHTKLEEISQGLFPVWMLTWRRGNRVAYAVMNGQTGKTYADIPADPVRFTGLSSVFGLPLFFLFLLLPTLSERAMLGVSLLLAAAAQGCFFLGSRRVRRQGYGADVCELTAGGVAAMDLLWLIVFLARPAGAVCMAGMVCCLLGVCAVMIAAVEKENLTQTMQAPGTKRWVPAFLQKSKQS